jgi:hypothetical protein
MLTPDEVTVIQATLKLLADRNIVMFDNPLTSKREYWTSGICTHFRTAHDVNSGSIVFFTPPQVFWMNNGHPEKHPAFK